MSRTEVNHHLPTLLSGGGDGVLDDVKKTPTRTPVPSCRRFGVSRNQQQQQQQHSIRCRLQKAVEEQKQLMKKKMPATPSPTSGPTRRPKLPRRSATVAEITPSKRSYTSVCRLTAMDVKATPVATDAGRRVYDLLLLNAWRRRREQVSTLTESSERLQEQVEQLQRQVEVLQDLRHSEGRRRSEAAHESILLRTALENEQEKFQQLSDEMVQIESEKSDLEKCVEDLRTEARNARNETLAVRNELRSSERQLNKEREKIGNLRQEKEALIAKVADCEKMIADQQETLKNLKETLENTETNLQTVLLTCMTVEEAKSTILRKLEEENQLCESLQLQLAHANSSMKKLQGRIVELKASLAEQQEANKKVDVENAALNEKVRALQDALSAERRRSWWKNAGELALAPIQALQNAAFVMLPAMPPQSGVTKATSTTDGFLSK